MMSTRPLFARHTVVIVMAAVMILSSMVAANREVSWTPPPLAIAHAQRVVVARYHLAAAVCTDLVTSTTIMEEVGVE